MSEETRKELERVLGDWKCFTYHTKNDREAVLGAIIEVVIDGINSGDIDQGRVTESVCCECEYKRVGRDLVR
jgi:hypothetical protein